MVGRAVDWRTDGHGFLLGVPHHDGVLVGFSYVQNRRLALCIRATDGMISHFRLLGLREMNFIQVCTGTIILDLMAWKLPEVPESLWRRDGGAWGVLSDPEFGSPGVRGMVERARRKRPEGYLFALTSDYGGKLAAVCDRIRIVRTAGWGEAVSGPGAEP
jgi:hypothetical protein